MNLTTWRTDISSLLTAAFPAAKLHAGERISETVSRDHDYICVFPGPVKPTAGNVNNVNATMTVRYWKAYPKLGALLADVPTDPGPIETLISDLAAVFKPHLTGEGIDYYHVESITPDVNDEYGVEVVLTGWTRNPAEAGG